MVNNADDIGASFFAYGSDEDDGDGFAPLLMAYAIWRHMQTMAMAFLVHCLWFVKEERAPPLFTQRLNWDEFVGIHGDRRDFRRHMRMSLSSFNKLLSYIKEDLQNDEDMAARRGGPILPELQLYCCI